MNDELYDFRVAGIDYSTRAVDVVTIQYTAPDLKDAIWDRLELSRGPAESFTNLLQIRERLGMVTNWAEVDLVYLEDPMSVSKGTAKQLGRVAGAIVASLPLVVRTNAVIQDVRPETWKHTLCGKGNASKDLVRKRVQQLGFHRLGATQDAFDAAGVCWSGRELNAQGIELVDRMAQQFQERRL